MRNEPVAVDCACMCGRFGFSDVEKMPERFSAARPLLIGPRYNAAPGQDLPVVLREEGENALALMRWGLVPSWAHDEKIGYKMINARVETVGERPSYREPLQSRRCLVPANWFFEWKPERVGPKTPYVIRREDGALFAMAGLYDMWERAGEEVLRSFTIITRSPNAVAGVIHDRMPLILQQDEEEVWLSADTKPLAFLKQVEPYPDSEMEVYPVSRLVNSAANDSPELIRRAQPPPLFG